MKRKIHVVSLLQFQIGTRFRNRFGEHFYRMVVIGFYPSLQTLILRFAVLLDPDRDNDYYTTTIWYSIDGYVYLGKFPVLPGNVHITGKMSHSGFNILPIC